MPLNCAISGCSSKQIEKNGIKKGCNKLGKKVALHR